MSSREFWEDDPQLYWAYRIFYLKKEELEIEKMKYNCWLQGKLNYIAHSSSLKDGFSKQGGKGFPNYNEIFKTNDNLLEHNKDNRDIIQQQEFNAWARF